MVSNNFMEIQMAFELGNPEGRGAQAVLEIQVDGGSKNHASIMGVWIFSGITHLDFWAESPQTMPHSDNNNFLYY